jgi:hypothetical protein
MRIAALVLGLALLPAAADAMTLRQQEFICPIDGKPFTQTVMTSGFSVGAYFDGELVGMIQSPSPLVICPGNGFILYRDGPYTQAVYTDAEMAKLRPFVASAEYQAWVANETRYYRLAKQLAFMAESPDAISDALLQATWEAGSGEQYSRYAAEALDALQQRAARAPAGDAAIATRLLIGELQRRLGLFDQARATFQALQADAAFPGGDDESGRKYRRQVLEAQLQLIAKQDSGRHRLDDDGKITDF